MDYFDLLGKAAGVVATAAFFPYVYSILKGKTKPSRASWLIWAVLGMSLLASYHYSGATSTIWVPLSYAILPSFIFLFSLKYGVGGFNRLDVFCLTGGALGLVLWALTDNPQAALYLSIFVDALGFLPTLKKTYYNPETESRIAWNCGAVANFLNLLAVKDWQLHIAIYPLYLFFFNTVLMPLLLYGVIQKYLKLKKA